MAYAIPKLEGWICNDCRWYSDDYFKMISHLKAHQNNSKGRADSHATLNNVDNGEVVSTHDDGCVGDMGSGEGN